MNKTALKKTMTGTIHEISSSAKEESTIKSHYSKRDTKDIFTPKANNKAKLILASSEWYENWNWGNLF